jgi:hypothetical protein
MLVNRQMNEMNVKAMLLILKEEGKREGKGK